MQPNDNWYRKHGQEPPEVTSHDLTPDDIKQRVQPINPTNWRLKGNTLYADTDLGPLVQTIDPGYILTGTDKQGLPTFKKV